MKEKAKPVYLCKRCAKIVQKNDPDLPWEKLGMCAKCYFYSRK